MHLCVYLHGEIGDVGCRWHLELKDTLDGSTVPVEHGAGHSSKGISGDDGGLYRELLDVWFSFLKYKSLKLSCCYTCKKYETFINILELMATCKDQH